MRPHSILEIMTALENCRDVWKLDTGRDRVDQILVGSKEEVEQTALDFFDMDKLPEHWTLERIGEEK